jgi:hypothetical protein
MSGGQEVSRKQDKVNQGKAYLEAFKAFKYGRWSRSAKKKQEAALSK